MQEGTTMTDTGSSEWPYLAELDAMVAAPDYHDLLFEDDRVRVLDAHVAPGDTGPVHTHQWGGVLYILSDSDFVRRDPDGTVLADTRLSASDLADGSAVWGDPLTPHSLENVGSKELRTITVEMKRAGTG
jgi:mannose-6-phosphate isomerase-like protein (cupin superfamily)